MKVVPLWAAAHGDKYAPCDASEASSLLSSHQGIRGVPRAFRHFPMRNQSSCARFPGLGFVVVERSSAFLGLPVRTTDTHGAPGGFRFGREGSAVVRNGNLDTIRGLELASSFAGSRLDLGEEIPLAWEAWGVTR
jgi:hypothetical protein